MPHSSLPTVGFQCRNVERSTRPASNNAGLTESKFLKQSKHLALLAQASTKDGFTDLQCNDDIRCSFA